MRQRRDAARRRADIAPTSAGSTTMASTISRSSISSQEMPTRPSSVFISRRSSSARRKTMVLAMESEEPSTALPPAACRAPARRPSRAARPARLHQRAGHRDPAHRPNVIDRNFEPDAEHQQNDADLGELQRQANVGGEQRACGHGDAGEQIADDRRKPQPQRDKAKHKRQHNRGDQSRDQRVLIHADIMDRRRPNGQRLRTAGFQPALVFVATDRDGAPSAKSVCVTLSNTKFGTVGWFVVVSPSGIRDPST